MKAKMLKFGRPVTLVGGGVLTFDMLDDAMPIAPEIVAADGAADRLQDLGVEPNAVIGDMDSIKDASAWEEGKAAFLHLPEQDSTDFEKCLYATEAPFYLAAGFTGARVDHTLAVFHALLCYPKKRVILLGEEEVIFAMPPRREMSFEVVPGATVSFYPMSPSKGLRSSGLQWPIEGLSMAAGSQIGTSNRAVSGRISAEFSEAGVLAMLPRRFLGEVLQGLGWQDQAKVRGQAPVP